MATLFHKQCFDSYAHLAKAILSDMHYLNQLNKDQLGALNIILSVVAQIWQQPTELAAEEFKTIWPNYLTLLAGAQHNILHKLFTKDVISKLDANGQLLLETINQELIKDHHLNHCFLNNYGNELSNFKDWMDNSYLPAITDQENLAKLQHLLSQIPITKRFNLFENTY